MVPVVGRDSVADGLGDGPDAYGCGKYAEIDIIHVLIISKQFVKPFTTTPVFRSAQGPTTVSDHLLQIVSWIHHLT